VSHWARRHYATVIFVVVGAVAATISFLAAPGLRGFCGAGLALLMFMIAYYDACHFIIPNILAGAAFVLVFACIVASAPDRLAPEIGLVLLRAAVTAGAFLTVKFGYRALRGRHGLGMGDVKLAAVAGAWLGWLTILFVIDIAVVVALGGYVLRQYVNHRPLRATSMLPFGLFLAPAIWLGWLLETTLWLGR
jgi:leader peptidase (prepilin peptidase) / N-methyltransferase